MTMFGLASNNATTHKIYLFLSRGSKAFTEGKIFSKYCNISKTKNKREGFHHPLPPPAPGEGVQLCVYVRGLNASYHTEIEYVNLIKSIISDDQ